MSLNTTQIFDLIDLEVKTNSTSFPIADKVLYMNLAMDDLLDIAIRNCGVGKFDDTNNQNFPEIKTDIVSGQQAYSYTQDQNGNLVLDIYQLWIKGPTGDFFLIPQVDPTDGTWPTYAFNSENGATGVPSCYARTGNGLLFDVIPNYDLDEGIKLIINREGSYFTIADTTKVPGFDGRLHEYFVVSPALKYADINGLASATKLEVRKQRLETKAVVVYAKKDKGVKPKITKQFIPFR